MTQYKYEISELVLSLHCNLSHMSFEREYNVHGTYEFFLWIVYWLSFSSWWLWYWRDIINYNYSFSKPSCLITIFTLCIAKAWKIETLYLSAARCGGLSHCGLCHNGAGREAAVLKWLSTYPHHLELLSDLLLAFSFKAVRKSQNISDLLQTLTSILWM